MAVRRPGSIRWLSIALLALLGWAADARAQEAAPKIDPAQIRFITPSASSSPCVGKPTTPMCGIETLIGCASYIWNEACAAINSPVYDHVRKDIRVEYVIVKAGFVNKDRVRAAHEADKPYDIGHWPWLTEDAFQAKVSDRTCPAALPSCEGIPWELGIYTVDPDDAVPKVWSASMYGLFRDENWFVD